MTLRHANSDRKSIHSAEMIMVKVLKHTAKICLYLLVLFVAVYTIFFEGWKDVIFGRYHRKANDLFRKTWNVNFVQIYLLQGRDDQSTTNTFPIRPYGKEVTVYGSTNLLGGELKEFLELWQIQSLNNGVQALCHYPVYGFRLYENTELVGETSFCWDCNNFYVTLFPGLSGFYGFDSQSAQSESLLDFCDTRMPYNKASKEAEQSAGGDAVPGAPQL